MSIPAPAVESAQTFVRFLNEAPTKYHAVAKLREMLLSNDFTELVINQEWNLQPGGKYFITQNGSCIAAFALCGKWAPGMPMAVIATHTDSPVLKVKPASKRGSSGFAELGVGQYGGGLWFTWFDRELKLAGRVFYRDANNNLVDKLVSIDEPLLYVPNLAIHYYRNSSEFTFDPETRLLPVIGLNTDNIDSTEVKNHGGIILKRLSEQLGCKPEDIVDMDVNLLDHTPAMLVGNNKEFIASGRQDNLVSAYCCIRAIIDAVKDSKFQMDNCAYISVAYDHEEVGSKSSEGAYTNFSTAVIKRIIGNNGISEAISKSMLISGDVGHGIHPNYLDYCEIRNSSTLDGGPVIKYNSQMKYTTNGKTALFAREIGRKANIPMQAFCVRNDGLSGSTLGGFIASELGIESFDLGIAMLGMHSIRELSGTVCISQLTDYYVAFFNHFSEVMAMFD